MADIQCKYKTSEYTLNTFDDVLKTVYWIRDALRAVFQNYAELDSHCYITFDSGDLSYDCKSIDEFKQYAFGKEINVKTMSIGISKNWYPSLISVYAHKQGVIMEQEYVLSSTDEKLLVDLRDALHTKKKGLPMNSVQTIINCEKHEDNSVHIGDGNKISNSTIGSKNTIEAEVEISNPALEKEKMVSKVFWQILIPVAVVVIGALVCIWLGIDAQ